MIMLMEKESEDLVQQENKNEIRRHKKFLKKIKFFLILEPQGKQTKYT